MMQTDSSRPPPTVERRRYDNRTPTLDMSDRRIADMIGSVAIGAPSENYDQKPRKRPTAQFGHPSARLTACIASSCTKCTKAIYRPWNRGWTIETTSSIFSVLSLANPVTTLVAHQDKPSAELATIDQYQLYCVLVLVAYENRSQYGLGRRYVDCRQGEDQKIRILTLDLHHSVKMAVVLQITIAERC